MNVHHHAWSALCALSLWILVAGGIPALADEALFDADEALVELQLLLEEPVTIASLTEQKLQDAPAIVTVITAQQIRDMGARTLTDVLETIPGVETLIQEYGYTEVMMRGGRLESQRIKFLINGHSMNPPRTGQPAIFLDDLTVENIDRIEIIRGPGSALYGTNAFSGVINILTKRLTNGVEAIVKGGTANTRVGGVLFGATIRELVLSGYAEYAETDGDDAVIARDAQSVLDDQFAPYGVPAVSRAPGQVQAWRQKTDLNLDLAYRGLTVTAKYLNKVNGPYLGANYTLNSRSEWNLDYVFIEGEYRHAFSDHLESALTVSWDRVTEDYFIEGSPPGFTIPFDLDGDGDIEYFPDGRLGQLRTSFDIVGGEWQGVYRSDHAHTIVAGASIQETRQFNNYTDSNFSRRTNAALEPGELDTSPSFTRNQRTVWAVFLQDRWQIHEQVGLTLGVRHDHYNDFGGTTNPRAALVWNVRPDLHVKALYGRAFLAPSFHELYLMNNPLMVGSDDLDPSTIETVEIGAAYTLADSITSTLTWFYARDEDIITPSVRPDPNTPATFVNVNGDAVQGVELELDVRMNDRLYGYANYSFKHAEARETGDDVPLNAPHLARLGLNVPLAAMLTANVQVAFVGERPREPQDDREPVDAYTLVDATVRFHDLIPGLELFCSVQNLLNATYFKPSMADTFPGDYPLPGRSVLVGGRYRWGS